MNPFALSGPEFLVFYTLFGILVVGGLYALRHSGEPDLHAGKVPLSDPNLIAYLRGGKNEALRVATVFLIDRGLLKVQGDLLETRNSNDGGRTPNLVEKAILSRFGNRDLARSLFADEPCEKAADRLRVALEQLGLLPSEGVKAARNGRLFLALVVLWLVALIKIVVGLRQDRPIGLLMVLGVGLTLAAWKFHDPWRTRRGEALLGDLETLFSHLRARAALLRPSSNAAEAALLAAVFGLAALPQDGWLHLRTLFSRGMTSRIAGTGPSCGAGCGSAGGSACGGGGGGGGCGGGGGGCGGCGG